jgi:hypothetical protein
MMLALDVEYIDTIFAQNRLAENSSPTTYCVSPTGPGRFRFGARSVRLENLSFYIPTSCPICFFWSTLLCMPSLHRIGARDESPHVGSCSSGTRKSNSPLMSCLVLFSTCCQTAVSPIGYGGWEQFPGSRPVLAGWCNISERCKWTSK